MKVLVTNAYSPRNLGDAAIVECLVRSLSGRETFRGASFRVSWIDPPADREGEREDLPSFRSLAASLGGSHRAAPAAFLVLLLPVSLLWAVLRRATGLRLPLPGGLGRLLAAYDTADLVVAAGGGYLYTTSARAGNAVLLMTVYSFLFGNLLGKPVYLFSQSVGPFASPLQEALVRRALRRVRMVVAREKESYDLLRSWDLSARVELAADAAFLLDPGPGAGAVDLPGGTGPLVGVTVRAWFRDPARQGGFERTAAEFLHWLIAARGARVVLLPQVTCASLGDDDRETARRILRLAGAPPAAVMVGDELAPVELMNLCGRMDLFIGTRMHSNIFALASGVPALAIAYQPKTPGIMAQLGLDRFVLPMEDLGLSCLVEAFDRLAREADIVRALIRQRLPAVREEAARAAALVEDDFRLLLSARRKR